MDCMSWKVRTRWVGCGCSRVKRSLQQRLGQGYHRRPIRTTRCLAWTRKLRQTIDEGGDTILSITIMSHVYGLVILTRSRLLNLDATHTSHQQLRPLQNTY